MIAAATPVTMPHAGDYVSCAAEAFLENGWLWRLGVPHEVPSEHDSSSPWQKHPRHTGVTESAGHTVGSCFELDTLLTCVTLGACQTWTGRGFHRGLD